MADVYDIIGIFPEQAREDGEILFIDLCVALRVGALPTSTIVDARVEDEGREYRVVVERQRGKVALSCTCREVTSSTACAHIWAALLEANDDRQRYRRRLMKNFDPSFLEHLDEWRLMSEELAEELGVPLPNKPKQGPKTRPTQASGHSSPWQDSFGTTRRETAQQPSPLSTSASPKRATTPASPKPTAVPPPPPKPAPPPKWKTRLRTIDTHISMGRHFSAKATDPMAGRPLRVAYFVAPGRSNEFPVELELLGARRRKNGDWGAWKKMEIPYEEIARVESEEDAAVLRRILGVIDWRVPSHGGGRTRVVLRAETFLDLVPGLATRGRLLGPQLHGSDTSRRPNDGSMSTKSYRGLSGEVRSRQVDMEPTNGIPIEWDAAGPWTMTLALHDDTEGRPIYHSRLRLVRDSDSLSPDGALYFPSGFALMENVLRHVQGDDVETWADAFHLPLEIDESDVDEFITAAAHVQGCPSIQAPESYRWNELSSPPVPRLVIAGPGEVPAPWRPGGGTSAGASTRRESTGVSAGASSSSSASPSTGASTNQSAGPSAAPSSGHRPPVGSWEEGAIGRGRLAAYMEFAYGDVLVDERCPEGRVLDTERRTLVMRHRPAEAEALRVASE
ncbi:MAG: hypothetical protein KDA27_28000, partial [Candidatus Eisenbacteria bacterium]|nr:hypothetical protein [Candidatus Eisenbacteria bacterium]